MLGEGLIGLLVAETVKALLQVGLCHFLIDVEDADGCFEWDAAEDVATGCRGCYKVEDQEAFPGFPGGVEGYRAVGRDDRFDEPLRVIELGGDDFVEIERVYPAVGFPGEGGATLRWWRQDVGIVFDGFVVSKGGPIADAFDDAVGDGLGDVAVAVFGKEAVAVGGGV